MTDTARRTSRYQSLRTSRRVLSRTAPLLRFGLWGIGISVFLKQIEPLVSDAQFTWGERQVMAAVALITIGGFGLAGWIAGRLLRASAEVIDLLIDSAEAAWRTADLIELQMVPALGRIAGALERSAPSATVASHDRALAAIRQAIAAQRWDQAEKGLAMLAREVPGLPQTDALHEELARQREVVVQHFRASIAKAQAQNDPDRVIDNRDALTQHLRGDALHDLDQQVVRWLVSAIQKQLRSGHDGESVARLAARVADSFGDTAEAASIRAALPNLRRTAGLCPRCGRTYGGAAEACPGCLGAGSATVHPTSTVSARPEESP